MMHPAEYLEQSMTGLVESWLAGTADAVECGDQAVTDYMETWENPSWDGKTCCFPGAHHNHDQYLSLMTQWQAWDFLNCTS